MVRSHPNTLVRAMRSIGYSLADALPAYPGMHEAELDQLLRDCALTMNRPVLAYGLLGIHPCRSRFFNISEHGFRSNGRIQPWPPPSDQETIACFGGSTTVGPGVKDAQTVPACLQWELEAGDAACQVYNFGSPSYTSRNEALRFLSLLDQGVRFDAAVFLDGYNDCHYAYGNSDLVCLLDGLYQREKRWRRQLRLRSAFEAAMAAGGRQTLFHTYDPAATDERAQRYLSPAGVMAALARSDEMVDPSELNAFDRALSQRVWDQYLLSVALIRAAAERYGITTVFAWQPVPYFQTAPRHRVMERLFSLYPYGALCWLVYQWLACTGFPSIGDDPSFVNCSGAGRGCDDVFYMDNCHYSAAGCQAVAALIAQALKPRLQAAGSEDAPAVVAGAAGGKCQPGS